MPWSTIVVLQIISSSFLTLWYRRTGIVLKNQTLQISFVVYICVAFCGVLISLFANNFTLPALPSKDALIFIAIEGFFIPAYWIIQFKLINLLGAASSVVIQTLNYWTTALFGLLLLGEELSTYFIYGFIFIVLAVYLSLSVNIRRLQTKASVKSFKNMKITLVIIAALFFAIGMTAEKLAIDKTGVWNYAFYGWLAQLGGATAFYYIFGNRKAKFISKKFLFYSVIAGFMTALSGFFFIYALSSGMLSKTIILTSSKIVLTSVLAVYFFKENNNLLRRFIALILALIGLLMIFLD
jgi:uncharacterized membrane protein